VEQSQRTIIAMQQAGFHSIKTMEFRLREHCKYRARFGARLVVSSNS